MKFVDNLKENIKPNMAIDESDDKETIGILADDLNISSSTEGSMFSSTETFDQTDNRENDQNITNVSNRKMNRTNKRGSDVLRERYEKRIVFRQESYKDIEQIGIDFFNDSKKCIRKKISPMSHSKRFWLTVKFFNDTRTGYSQSSICQLFGLNTNSVRAFVKKYKANSDNIKHLMGMFRGLSPIEMPLTRKRFYDTLMMYAMNVEQVKAMRK